MRYEINCTGVFLYQVGIKQLYIGLHFINLITDYSQLFSTTWK